MEKPRKYITAKVAMIDVGIARPGMIVARRFLRNTKMMMITSTAAISSVSCASLIERVTNSEPSNAVSMATPGGREAWIAGNSFRISWATWIRLALDCRTTPMATAEFPLNRSTLRSS